MKRLISTLLAVMLLMSSLVSVNAESPPYSKEFDSKDSMLSELAVYCENFPNIEDYFSGNLSEERPNMHLERRKVVIPNITADGYTATSYSYGEVIWGYGVSTVNSIYESADDRVTVLTYFHDNPVQIDETLESMSKDTTKNIYSGTVKSYNFVANEQIGELTSMCTYYIDLGNKLVIVYAHQRYNREFLDSFEFDTTDILLPVYVDNHDGCYSDTEDGKCINPEHNHAEKSIKDALAEYEAQTGEKVETNRYYFLMPNGENGQKCDDESITEMFGKYAKSWYNEYTDGASIYWWNSGVADPAIWPGYSMEKDEADSVFYADVPKAIKQIVFNNDVDGGMDTTSSIYEMDERTISIPCEYYSAGESENYPNGTESFDNMIYVIFPVQVSSGDLLSKSTWGGEWYYYYGDGCYGTVKDGNTADCIRDDHDHSDRFLHFDANTTGWKDYEKIYCHIWEYSEDPFFIWQQRAERCTDNDGDGIWTYDLAEHGIELEDGKQYAVIFSNENAYQTYNLLFDTTVLGDTAYCDGTRYDTPDGATRNPEFAYWRNQDKAKAGPEMKINFIGDITGTCIPKGVTEYDLFKDFLDRNFENAQIYSGKTDQQILDDLAKALKLSSDDVERALKETGITDVDWKHPDKKSVKDALAEYEAETGEKLETNRYYFLMPNGENGRRGNDPEGKNYNEFAPSWFNEYTDEAGIWWWGAEHFNTSSWPGYTMERLNDSDIFYADVPKEVESLMFNNTVDAGLDHNSPLREYEKFTTDVIACGYERGENELYPDGVASFDNMIFVVDPAFASGAMSDREQRSCNGDWYYYYGDGCYGTVKDGNTADCIREDHNHPKNFLYFDANTTDWVDYEKVFCHIWEKGGDSFFDWQTKQELCTDDDNDGVWSYNLDRAGISLKPMKTYAVIFSNENGEQMYHLEFRNTHIGNTAYLTDKTAVDNETEYKVPAWRTQQLHFDANTTGWEDFNRVFCHIFEYGGDSFFNWQAKAERCTDTDGDGIWTYDLVDKGVELDNSKQYAVIFSNENGLYTYNLLLDNTVLGDTAYCDDTFYVSPEDTSKLAQATFWRNQNKKVFGPELCILYTGDVAGTCVPKGTTKYEMFKKFLVDDLTQAQTFSGKNDQKLIDDIAKALDFTANEVEFIFEELEIYYMDCAWKKSKSTLEKSANTSPEQKDIHQVVRDYKNESGDEFSTKRYYFMMPEYGGAVLDDTSSQDKNERISWYNKYAQSAYIYWDGTDRLDLEGVGNMAMIADDHDNDIADELNIYYADVPDFVTSIEWNNGVELSGDVNDPMLPYAHKTVHIPCEYYDPGESPNYPDGTDSFDNMIFVLNGEYESFTPIGCAPGEIGEWYYYYGDSCYGTKKNGSKKDCLNPNHFYHKPDTYIVAGVEALCGSSWDLYDENNKMTFNEETGIYEITYKDVPVGNHEFMVTKNHEFGPITPGNPDYNEANVTVEGSTVTITYTVGVGVDVKVSPPLLGDVDLDGVISIMDATEIQLAMSKKITLDEKQERLADTDIDGEVSILDATAIQLFVAKKITEFK